MGFVGNAHRSPSRVCTWTKFDSSCVLFSSLFLRSLAAPPVARAPSLMGNGDHPDMVLEIEVHQVGTLGGRKDTGLGLELLDGLGHGGLRCDRHGACCSE